MAAKTLADLVGEVAARLGDYLRSTATAGGLSAIVDTAALYQPDEFWTGHFAYIVTDAVGQGAAPEGEERLVTAYARADNELTIEPDFSAAVGSGDTFELLPVQRATIIRAIGAAVEAAGETWLVPTVDTETLDVTAEDYDLSLPDDVVRLTKIWTRSDTDQPWAPVPGRQWHLRGTPGALVLYFDSLDGLASGADIRLDYLARPTVLSEDDDTLGLGEAGEVDLVKFVRAYARYWLHNQAASSAPEGATFRPQYTLGTVALQEAERIKAEAAPTQRGGSARTARWPRARG